VVQRIREVLADEASLYDVSQSYIIALCVARVFKIDINAAIEAHEPCMWIPPLRLPPSPSGSGTIQ
jgi:hypothetical protein